ncbi:transposase [bacterium]|nr:transposase [candidate division CSSED10-310 bacterium]
MEEIGSAQRQSPNDYDLSATIRKWRERKACRFEMPFLPPYSPELNPVERVWKMTRRKATHNKYFDSLQEVSSAVESTFKTWRYANDVLKRLCAI